MPTSYILLILLLVVTMTSIQALCHNLEAPWGEKPSGPFNPLATFSSRQSDDLLFSDGDEIEITCQGGVRSLALHWTLARNCFTTPFRSGAGEPLPGNKFRLRLATAGLLPGFYDLRVQVDAGLAKPIDAICTFGWKVASIPPAAPRPADFAAFWARGLEQLKQVPLVATTEPMQVFSRAEIDAYNTAHACLPPDFDPTGHKVEEVESCKISFAGIGGIRIHAWLAKPKGPGPFPTMLVLPGGGVSPRSRPLEHARHGYLAIDIQIHGQDVDLAKYPAMLGYSVPEDIVFAPIDAHYARNMYLNVVQAVNYLASRSDVDATRIVAVGGSQGGRLSVVVAGLDPRIRAIVPAIPHFANQPYRLWADACNRASPPRDGMDVAGIPPIIDSPEARCYSYYDPMNFAPGIRCPVFMNCGLIDAVSPPANAWAAFQAMPSTNKTFVPLPGFGHDWSAEFDRRALRWLDRVLAR